MFNYTILYSKLTLQGCDYSCLNISVSKLSYYYLHLIIENFTINLKFSLKWLLIIHEMTTTETLWQNIHVKSQSPWTFRKI